jgi:hypothetical protein
MSQNTSISTNLIHLAVYVLFNTKNIRYSSTDNNTRERKMKIHIRAQGSSNKQYSSQKFVYNWLVVYTATCEHTYRVAQKIHSDLWTYAQSGAKDTLQPVNICTGWRKKQTPTCEHMYTVAQKTHDMALLLPDLNCEMHQNLYEVKLLKFHVHIFYANTFFEDIIKMDLVRHVQWPLHRAYKNDILQF